MMRVVLAAWLLLLTGLSGFSELRASVSDTENMSGASSQAKVPEYVPGTDITEHLRNDLNAGLDVKLPAGHYYVSESIVVQGYSGTVKGAGKDATIVEAAQGFKALHNPYFWWGEFEVAEMFAFYFPKGDVTFKDMTILVTGNAPALEHLNPFLGSVTTIDNAVVVAAVGPEAESGITVTYKNLGIVGEDSDDPGSHNGKNLAYPLIATGWQGHGPISTVVNNCEIEDSGDSAIEYFDAGEGSAEIKDNEISNSYGGVWLGWGLELAAATVKDNRFTNIEPAPPIEANPLSSYCFKGNTEDGVLMPDDCQEED